MDLEGIMLTEISQTEKDKYCMITFNVEYGKAKLVKAESRWEWRFGGSGG